MATKRQKLLTPTWTLLALVSLLLIEACIPTGRGGSRESSSGGEAYSGTLTFSNQTSEPLCGIEIIQRDHFVAHTERVEPGAAVQLELEGAAEALFVTSCDGDGFLHAGEVSMTEETFAFSETEPQLYQERFDYLRRLNRMNTNPPMQDAAAQAQMHQGMLQKANDPRWIDTPEVTLIASDDWSINRHNLSGVITRRRLAALVAHRFPDGHCSIQIHTFEQMHDGSSFSGALRFEGSAGNIQTGCSMIEWMRAQGGGGGGASAGGGGASGGGASGGGGCSNTCSSANDGECDDGGPGAEYAVCGLGTDCADCGAR